jgi:hypothetical protein
VVNLRFFAPQEPRKRPILKNSPAEYHSNGKIRPEARKEILA